jgi:hypothetical protein
MKKILIIFPVIALITSCKTSSSSENSGNFPTYENYCGVDYPVAGTTPIPIDMVDLACRDHDECYAENGDLNLACDEKLLLDLERIEPQTSQEKAAKKLIIDYFKRSPKIQ